jgi:hypothetical protein
MFQESRDTTARLAIGIAVLLALLGSFISFVPGGEAWWFGLSAGAAAFGLLSPSRRARAIALVLVLLLLWQVRLGYQREQEYQEWLRQQEWRR